MSTVLKLYNNNPHLRTLEQFAAFYNIVFSKENDGFKIEDFFEQNREVIFSQLSSEQKIALAYSLEKPLDALKSSDITIGIKLPCPCYLYLEDKYLRYCSNAEGLSAKHTNFQVPTVSAIAFEDERIKNILQDAGGFIGDAKRISPGCRVLGWFKTMHFSDKSIEKNTNLGDIYNLKQNFLDLSKYIVSLNTNVGGSGGNFSIALPHIPLYSKLGLSVFSEEDYSLQNDEIGNALKISSENQGNLTPENVKASVNVFDYFDWLIQSNDLLFISFDEMRDLTDENLSGHVFDMIGLVESVSLSKNSNGVLSVNVSGRDLMKIITDDSSIFYPNNVANGNSNILKSYDNIETILNRGDLGGIKSLLRTTDVSGEISIFRQEPNDFSIEFVIKTMIHYLANMSVVPDDLFVSWGDKRTKVSELIPKEENGEK